MYTATTTGLDAAKTASKRVVQKTAEVTGDLIGNKIADKITSIAKPKEKEKQKKWKKFMFYQKKDNKLLMTLDCFECNSIEHKFYFLCMHLGDNSRKQRIKMEFQNIKNFLNTTSGENSERFLPKDLPRFITKKWVEVYDQSGGNYNFNKESKSKHQC